MNFLKFINTLRGGHASTASISSSELLAAAQEYQIRQLCFAVCVNMIANTLARCEIRTFRNHEEIREKEYHLWNVAPNRRQNSSAFWHKIAGSLCTKNEALIVSSGQSGNCEDLLVADDWMFADICLTRAPEYSSVQIGSLCYEKTFPEHDVLHLVLNSINVKPVLDGLHQSYYRLINAAMKCYEWDHGQHWKVHVNQLASGGKTASGEDWTTSFQKMIEAQVKPFLNNGGAILPEFDGYNYTNEGGNSDSNSRDIRSLIDDIFDFTATAFQIPAVLVRGQVSGSENAVTRFLSTCIDPLCDQIQEEITRKRYGYDEWQKGNYVRMDSSAILHFDVFANAPNVEKLVGSGAFTINDVLRASNQPTIKEPWADEHFLTKNIATMQEAAQSLDAR